jgi:hypothetical protein
MRSLSEEVARELRDDRLRLACRDRLALVARGLPRRRLRRSVGAGLISAGNRLLGGIPK